MFDEDHVLLDIGSQNGALSDAGFFHDFHAVIFDEVVELLVGGESAEIDPNQGNVLNFRFDEVSQEGFFFHQIVDENQSGGGLKQMLLDPAQELEHEFLADHRVGFHEQDVVVLLICFVLE